MASVSGATSRLGVLARIPGSVWALLALGVGMYLGSRHPESLAFIADGVMSALGMITRAAPFIIYFTLVAAIGDMLKTGSAAKFALYVTVTYILTTVIAGFWAILFLVPLFQLSFVGEAAAGGVVPILLDILDKTLLLATTSRPFIAIQWAVICAVGLHFLRKHKSTEWFARPTFEVIRLVGVDGVVLIGRGLRVALPFILFAIGVFIPTGVADAVARSETGIADAGGLAAFGDMSAVGWYFLTVGVIVLLLSTFFVAAAYGVCRYTGFSLKAFFRDYVMYVYPFAWATASSTTTIPINLERTERGLKVRREVRDFIIPLGATINLDGTMIAAFALTVVAGSIVGYTPSVLDLLILLIPLTVVTVGVPGIPGGMAFIAPPIITSFLPIPPEAVAAFIAIWVGFSIGLSDQFRTGVNSCNNGLVCLLYEYWYPSKFAKAAVGAAVPLAAIEGDPEDILPAGRE